MTALGVEEDKFIAFSMLIIQHLCILAVVSANMELVL